MEQILIEKYLIINSKREVLVFLHEGEPISDIFIPRHIRNSKEEVVFQKRMFNLLKLRVIKENDRVFLYEQSMYNNSYYDAKKENHQPITKVYYACISNFNDTLVGKINEICNECNILPYLIPLNVLKDRAWKSIKVPKNKRTTSIDIDLPKPIKILEYKLDYVEY